MLASFVSPRENDWIFYDRSISVEVNLRDHVIGKRIFQVRKNDASHRDFLSRAEFSQRSARELIGSSRGLRYQVRIETGHK